MGCIVCGEEYDTSPAENYRGKKISLCNTGECSMEFERDEQDACEYELQDAHDEVDRRFGYS